MSLEVQQLGRYRLIQQVGSGGMGTIFLAEDTQMSRQVAVKVIRVEADPYNNDQTLSETARLFEREMKAISMLDHPHILPVFDYGSEQVPNARLIYLVMPYRPEGSLADWLRTRNGQLTPQETQHFLLQAADALQHAHDRQIIHQDIKPSNFLIRIRNSELPDVLLADFGIAKIVNATTATSQSVRGTPSYMPPEQWDGRPVAASDQYSLAIMLYQFLTSQSPFRGGPVQIMRQHIDVAPPRPGSLNPHLSPAIDSVLLRALAKQPQERFPSVSHFAQAFRSALLESDAVQSPVTLSPLPPPATITNHFEQTDNVTAPSPPSTPISSSLSSINALSPAHSHQVMPLRSRLSRAQKMVLIAILVLLVLGGSGIVLATVVSNPTTGKPISQGEATTNQANTTATARTQGTATSQVLATTTVQAQASATTFAIASDPYLSGKGTLLTSDPLSGPKLWKNTTSGSWGGTCSFQDGAYHIAQNIGGSRYFHCDAGALQASNFIYEVEMTILKGTCGGITFRYNSEIHSGYRFHVCADGTALLKAYPDGAKFTTLFNSSSAAIRQGYNQSNTLAVVANGDTIDLYVNKQKIGSVIDRTLDNGTFALFASALTDPTEVVFREVKIWQI